MRMIVVFVCVVVAIIVGRFLFFRLNSSFGENPKGERLVRMEQSPNYKRGKFQNPVETTVQTDDMPFFKVLNEFLFAQGDRVPDGIISNKAFTPATDSTNNKSVRVTWLGHSTILIEMDGKVILTDPVFGKRVSPVSFMGTKEFPYKHKYKLEDLPEIDIVIISHDHYDHLDYKAILGLKDKKTAFVMPLGVGGHLERWGIGSDRITELDWWESFEFGGINFVATPARHFSGRRMNNRFSTLWASWVIEGKNERLFFGADSGYFPGYKEIGEKFGTFDLVMLECGQYSQYWPSIHMSPEETYKAAEDLNAKLVLPIHWGRYKLSIHSWTEPVERFIKAAEKGEVAFTIPEIGDSFYPKGKILNSNWWKD